MDISTKAAFVIAFVAVASLLLLFGGGMATRSMIDGGMMGSASMGLSWVWLPLLLVITLSTVFFSGIFKKQ